MPKQFLDDSFARRARCPDNKGQEFFWDHPIGTDSKVRMGAVAGLGLRVTRQGHKSFVHALHFNGRRRRIALGQFPVLNVAAARLKVLEREKRIAAGENPDHGVIDPHRKHALTVGDVIDEYWHGHLGKLSPGYRYTATLFLAGWHKQAPSRPTRRGHNQRKPHLDFGTMFRDRPLVSIKPLDIQRYTKQFTSPHSHNSGVKHVSALFNWAIRMQLVDMRNPCDPISRRKVVRKRRDYTPEQIKQIAGYIFQPPLEPLPNTDDLSGLTKRDAALARGRIVTANRQMEECCAFMGILFLTMARPNELMRAEFEHFDLERLVWHKHDTKGIKLSRSVYEYAFRSVPIHPRVAELVTAQRLRWPDTKLVFPSHADPTQPRDNFRRALTRFKGLTNVPDYFQLYDLKRIAISLMLTGQGVSREAVSHYVDHKGRLETTAIYDLGFVDPLRPVTERLGELLEI